MEGVLANQMDKNVSVPYLIKSFIFLEKRINPLFGKGED